MDVEQLLRKCIKCGKDFVIGLGHQVVCHAINKDNPDVLRHINPPIFTASICKQCYLSFPQDIVYDYEDHIVTYNIKCTGPVNTIRFRCYNNPRMCIVQIVHTYGGMHEAMKGG